MLLYNIFLKLYGMKVLVSKNIYDDDNRTIKQQDKIEIQIDSDHDVNQKNINIINKTKYCRQMIRISINIFYRLFVFCSIL